MKKTIILFAAILISLNSIFAQYAGSESVALEIDIEQLISSKGWIALQLLSSDNKKVASAYVNISEGRSKVVFNYLEPGNYAIRFYHDENGNGKMETNVLGMPTEGYGFSNNASSYFGPPDFNDMLFPIMKNTSIKLDVQY